MKRQLRKAERTLQQIVKRISEKQAQPVECKNKGVEISVYHSHALGPLPQNVHAHYQFKLIEWNGFFFGSNHRDRHVLLKNKRVVVIRNVIEHCSMYFLVVNAYCSEEYSERVVRV